ncbi:hypothetical protein ACOMHN_019736 [Nucella lapillus]
MASLFVTGGSNFRGNFSMYQLQPHRFVPDLPVSGSVQYGHELELYKRLSVIPSRPVSRSSDGGDRAVYEPSVSSLTSGRNVTEQQRESDKSEGMLLKDSRTGTGEDGGGGLQGGMLTSSMPDLRRETVVLTRQHLPAKNIPIIDDDDETNIDDDEDFYPAYLNDKLPKNENERISSEEVGSRRRTVNGDLLGGRSSDGVGFPHWSNQTSLDSEDTAHSTDWEDLEDSDALLDATRIIYPPSKPGVGDTCDSTYQVFAADEIRKRIRGRTSSTHTDEDDGPWLRVSVEGSSDVQDEARVTSLPSGSQPHTDGSVFLPTLDKEQFVKENFDSVRFTPVAMDRFAQQVASLEQAADVSIDQTGGLPFSPRLSLSSRFLSRSHFVGVRHAVLCKECFLLHVLVPLTGMCMLSPCLLQSVPESKSILAHSMEDMRKRLAAMNWRTGGLIQESPEKDDPHSPPTKLENKELVDQLRQGPCPAPAQTQPSPTCPSGENTPSPKSLSPTR